MYSMEIMKIGLNVIPLSELNFDYKENVYIWTLSRRKILNKNSKF